MKKVIVAVVALMPVIVASECDKPKSEPQSVSGVNQAGVQVPTGSDGLTAEQRNVRERLLEDNKPGSIKHLYVISAYSGQVIIYSTVRGKVTSGGKRLSPTSVAAMDGEYVGYDHEGIPVNIGGTTRRTGEVLQDDGTYGYSMDYLYWWDTKGVYHQHYVSGGQIVHISNQPLAVRGIIINMEISGESEGEEEK